MKVGAWHLSIEPNDCPTELTKITAETTDRRRDRQIDRHFFSTMLGGRNDLYAGGIIISM